ncbi:MAG: esterase-like activity of phytase family protein [Planctomycetota bacterium]
MPPLFAALVIVLTANAAPAADGPAAPPSVEFAGSLRLPEIVGPNGPPLTGLSGIAWMGNDRYAAVLDNSDHLLLFRLAVGPTGAPEAASDLRFITLGEVHDYEDVAPCPPALARRIATRRRERGDRVPATVLLVCEEDTPAIRAIDADSGDLLGIVPIPPRLAQRRPNRGLESVAVEPDGRCIWAATEEALPADGPAAADGRGTVVRIARIPVPDSTAPPPAAEFAYAVDPPHAFVRVLAGEPLAGLVALVPLGSGRLLALERSAGPGLPPFESRLALIDTASGRDVSDREGSLASRPDDHLAKVSVWRDTLGCNLEGLCLGPRLADGRRLLVGVADNGGLGTPTQLVTLKLREGPAPIDASALGLAAALAGTALLALRLTSPSPCSTR